MPDVSRSDSQRSDASQRPRVSFNRDVHVKRIGNPGTPRVVGALAGDGEGHLVPLPVRRERPTRLSRRELAKEAERVLQQADSVECTSSPLPDLGRRTKYSTLPPLRSRRHPRRPKLLVSSPSSSPEPGKGGGRPRRNLVVSIFSSLDRARGKKSYSDNEGKSSLKKTNSTSLSDLLQTSSSSPERSSDTKTRRTKLARSASDSRKAPRGQGLLKVPDFSSLDRTAARKSKNRIRSNTDDSGRSPSPPPRRNRKHVLKKSHSDSESPSHFAIPEHVQADLGGKKSQLSPIIEASPHDDYFEEGRGGTELRTDQELDGDMHSSQVTTRPPLTRGRTVDVMVKRLSQDPTLGRAPPRRINSPAGLVAPGEERQHNNNMPFSYTRPTQGTPTRGRRAAPTAEGGQVIYAEVVVGGGGSGSPGKQTVHTQVPGGKQEQLVTGGRINIENASDEDEGLGLSMDGYRRGSADYLDSDARTLGQRGFDSFDRGHSPKANGYRSQVREFINSEKDDNSLRSTSRIVSDMRMDYGGKASGSSVFKKEYVVQESSCYDGGSYILDPPGRGRADGMDSWKKEALLESNRYENEFNRRENDRKTPQTSHFSDGYTRSENYNREYNLNSKYVKNDDDIDFSYRSDRLKKDPLIEPNIINRSDLSSRRNRLESRIESHRKDRLLNTKLQQKEKRDILLETKANEANKKYLPDHKSNTDATFNNRRDFLNSQIDFENGRLRNDKKYDSENIVRTNFYNESLTEVDSHGKKDLFADSGIEMDYRKDSSGTVVNKFNDTPRTRGHNNDSPAKISVNKWQSSNVTRVDINGHSNDRLTDDDDVDPPHYKPTANKHSSYTKEMTSDSFISARLVKEQKKTTEAIPSSTVLIRHFAPGRGSPDHLQERRYKYDDVDQREESPERDWKAEKHARRNDEQPVKKREDEENAKNKEEAPKKEDKKKKEPEDAKTADKKAEAKKVKKKQVTAMDKMRQLFSRSDTKTLKKNKKKEDKSKGEKNKDDVQEEPEEDPLASRYTEYRGSNVEEDRDTSRTSHRGEQHRRLSSDAEEQQELGRSRERLATPSPVPPHAATLGRRDDAKGKDASWFKSLDRTAGKSSRPAGGKVVPDARARTDAAALQIENVTEDEAQHPSGNNKSLRFFGDTDVESVYVARGHAPTRRYKNNSGGGGGNRLQVPQRAPAGGLRNQHRHHRSTGDVATSSAESTTEGDSSQQSQKSVVYLHAATVGDIPNRNVVARSQRRSQSREELSSVASSHRLQPQTRTVSRSISVLAPWRPRHFKDNMEVHYENEMPNRGNGKPPKVPPSHQANGNSSTMNRSTTRRRPEDQARTSPQKQKVGKAMSVESLSRQDIPAGATKKRNLSTSIESLSHRGGAAKTQNHSGSRMSKKSSALNASAMELSNSRTYKTGTAKKVADGRKDSAKLSRSASMPKDARASGWFKLKSKKQAA